MIVGALALTGVAPARQAYQQRQQVAVAEQKVTALQERNSELTDRLNRLSDVAYMEKLAREQLGVVRPGDTAYVVVPPPSPVRPAATVEPADMTLRERVAEWVKDLVGKD